MENEKFFTIAIDETEHWDTDCLKQHGIRAAFGLYLIRDGEATHLCSLTASSYAINLRNAFVFNSDVSQSDREWSEDELCHEGLENTYVNFVDPDKYDSRFITDPFEIEPNEVPNTGGEYDAELRDYAQSNWDRYGDEPRITWGDDVFEVWVVGRLVARRAENRPVLAYPVLPLFIHTSLAEEPIIC